MKYGKVETKKLYFSSSEAAEKVGVPVEVLRSWERQFPKLNPNKNGAGKRVYRQSDIEIAKHIKATSEAPPKKAAMKKPPKTTNSNPNNSQSMESLLKIRDRLQKALGKIKK